MTAQSPSRDARFFDLSARVKLRLSGPDCLRFLNGQLTNDVRKANETTAIEACVLNAKGKMDAHLFLHVNGDSFLLDADAALKSTLQPRLERYVIADDVVIEDVTEQLSIFHVIGGWDPRLFDTARIVSVNRLGPDGHDLWIESSKHDEALDELSKALIYCDENCAEIFRIERGIPRWGRELTNEIIPVEANLEQRCIDYEKGCYIGQETISRMKMSGQRSKQLCGLVSLKNVPLVAGSQLFPEGEAITPDCPKTTGWITSATRSGDREIALGYVKRGHNTVGARVQALMGESTTVPAEIVDLPFIHR